MSENQVYSEQAANIFFEDFGNGADLYITAERLS